ncbi:unnamed protein product [Adineta steineri]|uniref:G-protein coupled receptors family 1 profile domain-containing protein n=1 Tax=Adineta steineri TaxID=433720 RepID=A0A819DH69_9BILA|nr:unnamed protein product [Adineta steineri]
MSSTANSYYYELLTIIPIYLSRYVSSVLYIVGNIGNLLTISLFLQKSWKKNVCVFYFLVFLLSNTIYINSSVIGSIFTIGFNIDLTNSSVVLCKLYVYISYLCSAFFPIILILASIDRLLISSQNVDTRLYSSKRLAYFSTSIATFICVVFYFHVLIKFNIQEIYPGVFICYYDLSKFYLAFSTYSDIIFIVIISFVLVILSVLSFKNVRHIQTVPRQERRQIRTMNKKDFQLLRCLYIHNIMFIICSTLTLINIGYGTAIKYQTVTSFEQAIQTFLTLLNTFIHSIPFCTSFFIFISISRAFRLELKRFLYRIYGKNLTTVRDEDNHQPVSSRKNIELRRVVSTIVV